jgi:hypothetical protein
VWNKRVVAFLKNSNDKKAQFYVRFCTVKYYKVNIRLAGTVRVQQACTSTTIEASFS